MTPSTRPVQANSDPFATPVYLSPVDWHPCIRAAVELDGNSRAPSGLAGGYGTENIALGKTVIAVISTVQGSPANATVGEYRGWESGHGLPPATRNDWVIRDETGALYATGDSQGLRHPADIGKPVTITGIVRSKNEVPYIGILSRP